MPVLAFEVLPATHEDHKPVLEGDYLVLCAVEGPTFIKKGTSKFVRTGTKLQVPAKHLCGVAYRRKHGNGSVLSDVTMYTSSKKLDDAGKPVEGSDGEGLTGEISVLVAAPMSSDLNIRVGEPFAVAFLSQLERPSLEPKTKKST